MQVLGIADFERLFELSGIKKLAVFGNYNLDVFDVKRADRLILVGQKNA